MPILVVLGILVGAVVYFMTAEERGRVLAAARGWLRQAYSAAAQLHADDSLFGTTLEARTARALVSPALIVVQTMIFLAILFGPGSMSDPATFVRWGASFGPPTTNGEWWRLVTAIVVPAGPIALLVDVAMLATIGILLEKLFGRLAFAGIYIAAGLLSNLAVLAVHPMGSARGHPERPSGSAVYSSRG